MDRFDYFYGVEAEQYSFFRMPKILFQNEKFAKISCEAKLLYGIMLDRMGLSKKNGWMDEKKRVYIIFTIEEIMEMLSCSKPTAVKILAELDGETGIGLIEKQRKRFNCPSRIYVKNFIRLLNEEEKQSEENEEEKQSEEQERMENVNHETFLQNDLQEKKAKVDSLKLKKFTSKQKPKMEKDVEVKKINFETEIQGKEILPQEEIRGKKTLPLEVKKFNPINTNPSKTDSNISNPSIYHKKNLSAGIKDADRWREHIQTKIEYSCLCEDYKNSIDLIYELVELMVETFMVKNGKIRISGEYYSSGFVQSRLEKIDMTHIQYVLDCLQKNQSQVRNIKSYLLTALFNAPVTINNFYQQRVNADYVYAQD